MFTLLAMSASAMFAQSPIVNEILNNYSLINAGSVAQGAIFIVKGINLSDQTTGLQEVPLQTTLQGVQIAISVSGITTLAPMYYVLPQQLAGILPSSTPLGTGTLVVRNNGKNSLAVPITVVRSAFGMLTVSGTGTGSARVQDASQNYQELISSRSTKPGNFLVFYGSGVGAVNSDETVTQIPSDLTAIPTTVTIGGKNAQVFYRGRTLFPGLDQINVQVPTLDAATYGCTVPVVITTGGVQSNITTIPVAQTGSTCPTPSGTGSGPVPSATQQEITQWSAAGSFTTGSIALGRTTLYAVADVLPGVTASTTISKTDAFGGSFSRVSGSELGRYLRGEGASAYTPAVGSCVVYPGLLADQLPPLTVAALDAGASIVSTGPGGARTATRSGVAYAAPNTGTFLSSGRYAISGAGGPGVGAFSGSFDASAEFTVTNPEDFKQINRDSGVTVRWVGGDATVPVLITGTSVPVTALGTLGTPVNFACSANAADGRFTVPGNILTQLPATSSFAGAGFTLPLRGAFTVTSAGKGVRITAPGVDYLTANNAWTWTVTTDYR
ncbi:MAG: hypothetical protein ABIR70_23160 [Bryobacteraceae bacterium]